jgi:anti-anti-sigma factor
MAIDITVWQVQGRLPVTILQPHGEVDASNYQQLIAEAQRVFRDGARDLLLDLSDVSYMSSSGLVALQSVASLLRGEQLPDLEAGWGTLHALDRDRDMGLQPHFKLCSPQPRVDQVLDMVGFKRFLEVHVDRQAAVAAF